MFDSKLLDNSKFYPMLLSTQRVHHDVTHDVNHNSEKSYRESFFYSAWKINSVFWGVFCVFLCFCVFFESRLNSVWGQNGVILVSYNTITSLLCHFAFSGYLTALQSHTVVNSFSSHFF
jgi:hypothetical protein